MKTSFGKPVYLDEGLNHSSVSFGGFSEIARVVNGITVPCLPPPTKRYVRFNLDDWRFEQKDNLNGPWEAITR